MLESQTEHLLNALPQFELAKPYTIREALEMQSGITEQPLREVISGPHFPKIVDAVECLKQVKVGHPGRNSDKRAYSKSWEPGDARCGGCPRNPNVDTAGLTLVKCPWIEKNI